MLHAVCPYGICQDLLFFVLFFPAPCPAPAPAPGLRWFIFVFLKFASVSQSTNNLKRRNGGAQTQHQIYFRWQLSHLITQQTSSFSFITFYSNESCRIKAPDGMTVPQYWILPPTGQEERETPRGPSTILWITASWITRKRTTPPVMLLPLRPTKVLVSEIQLAIHEKVN